MKMFALAITCSLHLFAAMPATATESDSRDVADAGAATLSEQAASKIAAGQFPDAVFDSAELERENGRLVWSIDMRRGGSDAEQEVQVDATTGAIIAVESEDADSQGDDPDRAEHDDTDRESVT